MSNKSSYPENLNHCKFILTFKNILIKFAFIGVTFILEMILTLETRFMLIHPSIIAKLKYNLTKMLTLTTVN